MNSLYGSEWRKWDFHVHTPYSLLNNQYGINPFEDDCDFDNYVKELFTRAVDKGIAAIGITDYFMIEGYKRIRTQYLDKPEKMKECFPDEELRQKVEKIYVFPNIEFRIPTFVGGKKSVNYHVIFSDQVPIREIEENFLHLLPISPEHGQRRTLTLSNIESIGRMVKEDNNNSGSDLEVGLEMITISDEKVLDTLQANSIFSGQYLIAVPVDEHLSKVPWKGRDYLSRKALHRQAHCYMTANPKSRDIALAHGHEEDYIREFGSIKPCIWGSDAHEYSRMFEPDEQRYCWIKADTTFEGLLQILYEPAERVKIQKVKPDSKDLHQIIDSITFDDERFQPDPVFFNDNLTCIIGGKSTGKSLLLRQLAASIDSEHVRKREKNTGVRRNFEYPKATVQWKDGTVGSRKIVYIPQTFLNRTVDDSEQATEITRIIEGVLKQQPAIAAALEELRSTLSKIKEKCKSDVSKYCATTKEIRDLNQTILREGSASTYKTTIDKLECERTELAEKADVSQEEIDRYAELVKIIQRLKNKQAILKSQITSLNELHSPAVIIPGQFVCSDGISISHSFKSNLEQFADIFLRTISEMTEKIQPDWEAMRENLKSELTKEFVDVGLALIDSQKEFEDLKEKVERNDQLQQIARQIIEETKRYDAAVEREKELLRLQSKAKELKSQIVASQVQYYNAYTQYSDTVKAADAINDTSLKFDAQIVWKKKDFTTGMVNIFDNRNFSAFRSRTHYDLQELEESDYCEKFLTALFEAINSPSWGSLMLKSAFSVEQALNNIFQDWYNIHYIVSSGSDTIEQMSPGKKALVLLELLINLEENKCPILIDQPEDDLDNRSIYYDLVQFIRKKKLDRQIIVVTHNANIVLGADTEEVIVANQNGHDTPNAHYRFEYRSGAIENDIVEKDPSGNSLPGVLNQSGIQTQICDILEGGKIAFELRQHKYTAIPNQ